MVEERKREKMEGDGMNLRAAISLDNVMPFKTPFSVPAPLFIHTNKTILLYVRLYHRSGEVAVWRKGEIPEDEVVCVHPILSHE